MKHKKMFNTDEGKSPPFPLSITPNSILLFSSGIPAESVGYSPALVREVEEDKSRPTSDIPVAKRRINAVLSNRFSETRIIHFLKIEAIWFFSSEVIYA